MRVATRLIIAAAFAVAAVALARHAAGYFFLYDDFAMVIIGKENPLSYLLAKPQLGLYRPTGFVALWASARLFGWETPAGHALVSLILHAINVGLCVVFVRTFADRVTAWLAGLLFLMSPWATEGFLWLSGTFDLSATFGVLLTLIGVRLFVAGKPGSTLRQAALLAGIVTAALIAFFAKESTITLPALAAVWALRVPSASAAGESGSRSESRSESASESGSSLGATAEWRVTRRGVIAIACLVPPTLFYMAMRAHNIGMLSGAYGSLGALFAQAHIAQNLWSYARAFVTPPLPSDWSLSTVLYRVVLVYPFLAAVTPALALRGTMSEPRLLGACVTSILFALAPVAWFSLSADNTLSGRYAYLPGIWFAIMIATSLRGLIAAAEHAGVSKASEAVSHETRGSAVRGAVAVAALVIVCGYYLGSLVHQLALWRSASGLARSVMAQVEVYRGQTDRGIHITNLPHVAIEGPWIMKGYAFRYYRNGKDMPPVRADLVLMRLAPDVKPIAPAGPDPFSDYHTADGREETPLTLDLRASP